MSPGHNADGRLRSFIDRVLRLKEEQDALAADIREVYAEAKGEGFDKTAMGNLVSHLRKIDKHGADAVDATETVFALYLDAYRRATGTPVATHAHTHEGSAPTGGQGSSAGHEGPSSAGNEAEKIPAQFLPAPHDPGAADGQPSIPSSAADGAKMEGRANASPERADAKSGLISVQAEQAVTDFQPPAFLVKQKTAADYRPHCQNPSQCASSSLRHCHACQKLADAAEGEAA